MSNEAATPPPLPGAGMDLRDPAVVADLFSRAAEANLSDPRRKGASIFLPSSGRLLISGDLHDNGNNFFKTLHAAALHESPRNHLIIQEVIHGPHMLNNMDLSVRTLTRVAALKLMYPEQVCVLQSNHELAQMLGSGIMKDGHSVTEAYDAGLAFIFGEEVETVRQAMNRFIRSYPLCVRCPRGLFCSHSLPSQTAMKRFDPTVIDRELTDEDLHIKGAAYDMVWGRHHPQEVTDELCKKWGASIVVVGHQPAPMGYEIQNRSQLIITTDHECGMVLPIDLAKRYTIDDLIMDLMPLSGVEV